MPKAAHCDMKISTTTRSMNILQHLGSDCVAWVEVKHMPRGTCQRAPSSSRRHGDKSVLCLEMVPWMTSGGDLLRVAICLDCILLSNLKRLC